MNLSGNSMDVAALRVRGVFASQRVAFEADPYPLADRRREKIKALKRQISRYQDVLADAMSKDFGFRDRLSRKCSTCSDQCLRPTTP
jgi:coniferyl-aldehyde dehydrogenase